MKRILPYLFVLIATTHAFALTTNQLAVFLGIDSWESKVALPPGSFSAQVFEFADGKVTKPITRPFAAPTSAGGDTPISIIWRGVDASIDLRLALDQLSMAANPGACPRFNGPFITSGAPSTIKKGDFIVGGEPLEQGGVYRASKDLKGYKRGLLLRITDKAGALTQSR